MYLQMKVKILILSQLIHYYLGNTVLSFWLSMIWTHCANIIFSFQASMFSLSEARILDNDANESNFMTVFNQLTRLNLEGQEIHPRDMPLQGIWILLRKIWFSNTKMSFFENNNSKIDERQTICCWLEAVFVNRDDCFLFFSPSIFFLIHKNKMTFLHLDNKSAKMNDVYIK